MRKFLQIHLLLARNLDLEEGRGQGSGQIIDKGGRQPIFFILQYNPPFKLSFITIKCKSMADVLKKY